MKNLLALLCVSLFLSSCLREVFCEEGKGDIFTETLSISEFTGIDLKEAADVTIVQGDEQKVVVTARENILDRLETEVNGGIWEINLGRDCYQNLNLDIEITTPFIEDIHMSGAGTIDVGTFVGLEDLDISISGSGRIQLSSITGTEDIEVKISGSGELRVSDEFPDLDHLNVEISGSGDFDAYDMVAQQVEARISGAGNIFVTVENELDIRITGSGNLHYKGNPLIDARITGSGRIINEN